MKKSTSRFFRKTLIWFGVVFTLLFIAILTIPFLVDVDKYRPQIVELANQKLNGKLQLGKLRLSLWGQIRIEVDGFSLEDRQSRKVVTSQDVFFHLPLLPLIMGSPAVTFKIKNPQIVVLKDKEGKLNLLSLIKTEKGEGQNATTPAPGAVVNAPPANIGADAGGGVKGATSIPAIVKRARLGIELREADLTYRDEQTALVSEVKDFSFVVKDLSLSKPTELEFLAQLNTKMGKNFQLDGPVKITARFEPNIQVKNQAAARFVANVDLDALAIQVPSSFHKKAGLPTNAYLALALVPWDDSFQPKEVVIETMTFRFHNAEVSLNGVAEKVLENPSLNLQLKSNAISLQGWSDLVPALRSYDLSGQVGFQGQVMGLAKSPQYQIDLTAKDVSAKAPNLKAQPKIQASVRVSTDRVEKLSLSMTAPGNQLQFTGSIISFTKPNLNLQISSSGLDLDQLIVFPKPPETKTAGSTGSAGNVGSTGSSGTGGSKGTALSSSSVGNQEDMDAKLDPLRNNPMLAGMVAKIQFNFAFLKAYEVRMPGLQGAMSLQDLTFAIESFQTGLWDGKIKLSSRVQMKPKVPTYQFVAEVQKLDLQKAVASQWKSFENTVVGKATFKMQGSGSSFNPELAKTNLSTKGNLRIEDPSFVSIDVGKMATEAINKAIKQAKEKIPVPLEDLKPPDIHHSKYKLMQSDFSITGGKFHAPNFAAIAEPNLGIDVKGDTKLSLKEKEIHANWELVDTYNVTRARDISVESNGVKVEHIFADGNGAIRFPLEVTGNLASPNVNYGKVPESLAKVALNNISKALQNRVKQEVQKRVQDEAKKVLEKPLQDALQGLGSSIFGN